MATSSGGPSSQPPSPFTKEVLKWRQFLCAIFFVDQLITILTMREKPHDFDCIDRRCTRTTATGNQNTWREKAEPSRAPKRRLDVSTTERSLKTDLPVRTPSRRDVIQIEKQRFVARMPHRKVRNISNQHFNGKKLVKNSWKNNDSTDKRMITIRDPWCKHGVCICFRKQR